MGRALENNDGQEWRFWQKSPSRHNIWAARADCVAIVFCRLTFVMSGHPISKPLAITSWIHLHEPTLIAQKDWMWQQIYSDLITAVVRARNGTMSHPISLYHRRTRSFSRKTFASFLAKVRMLAEYLRVATQTTVCPEQSDKVLSALKKRNVLPGRRCLLLGVFSAGS